MDAASGRLQSADKIQRYLLEAVPKENQILCRYLFYRSAFPWAGGEGGCSETFAAVHT